jgi:hypothetical protein
VPATQEGNAILRRGASRAAGLTTSAHECQQMVSSIRAPAQVDGFWTATAPVQLLRR